MSYGIGIVGTGMIARHHARAVEDLPGVRVVAAMDSDHSRAAAFAQEMNCAAYDDLQRFLADDNVSIVAICSPSGAHLDVALAAARAGKHLLIEKPLEITLDRCDQIIDAAARHGVNLGGIFQSRFFDASRVVKDAVAAGRLGRPVMGDAYVKWFRPQSYYDTGGWKGTKALDGGGALMNQSIHAIDLLQWYMGPVRAVQAFTGILGHERIEVEDTAVAAIEFASGAMGVIEGSTAVFPGFLKRVELSGTAGSIVLEEEEIKTWRFAEEQPEDEEIRRKYGAAGSSGGGASDPGAISVEGHHRQYADFVAALESGSPLELNGLEARKSVAIILAIYESARTGKRVAVPE
ncbi:MAG: gfo/Idh/MocA family oxidoreductase [Spirochaetaceae bacterium]|nr:MAG: gfo/Idh/MocA family oxidoreductase [Spirochaetaceae bacterium]